MIQSFTCVDVGLRKKTRYWKSALSVENFVKCHARTRMIYAGEWYIKCFFMKRAMKKLHYSHLFVQRLFIGRSGRF